jgi:hypothetical protein
VSEAQISIRFEGKNDVWISVVANQKKQKRPAGFYAGVKSQRKKLKANAKEGGGNSSSVARQNLADAR